MLLPGIRVATITHTKPPFAFSFGDDLARPELAQIESVIAAALAHLEIHHPNQHTIVAHTLIALTKWPSSQDSSGPALDGLLKVVTIAKGYADQQTEEEPIELFPLLKRLRADLQQPCETMVQENSVLERAICLTDASRICLAPGYSKPGDIVVVFPSMHNLCILRPAGKHYRYVGTTYMHGLMEGETTKRAGWKKSIKKFSII
jgi:hypothetical protein